MMWVCEAYYGKSDNVDFQTNIWIPILIVLPHAWTTFKFILIWFIASAHYTLHQSNVRVPNRNNGFTYMPTEHHVTHLCSLCAHLLYLCKFCANFYPNLCLCSVGDDFFNLIRFHSIDKNQYCNYTQFECVRKQSNLDRAHRYHEEHYPCISTCEELLFHVIGYVKSPRG